MLSETLSPSIPEAIALFELDAKGRRLSPKTIEFYQYQLPQFAVWCERQGVTTLAGITPALVRAFLVHQQERNLAAWTVHGSARAIRAWFNFLVNEEILTQSPMRKVQMPKLEKRILPAFEQDDVRRILAACDNARDRAAVLFLVDTGLRASEFMNLNGGDVDLATGTVRVRLGKGGKDRIVYLGGSAAKALGKYYIQAGAPTGDEPVFRSGKTGGRLTKTGLRLLLWRLGKRAGVANCHPHTFRRTFALWSLRAGMSIYHLQRLMGHEDITVLRRYLALVETDIRQAHAQYGPVDLLLAR